MPAEHDDIAAVERACEELAASGQPISFKEVAARAGTSRTTLYRRADLRALVEEHRTRGGGRACSPVSPCRSTSCAAAWKLSRPRSADKKNGSVSSSAEIAGTAETLPPRVIHRLTQDWPDKRERTPVGDIS